MENIELTIAAGVVIFTYRRLEITARQEDLDSPFSFEFTLDDKTICRKTKTKSLHTWLATFALASIRHCESVGEPIKNPPGEFCRRVLYAHAYRGLENIPTTSRD